MKFMRQFQRDARNVSTQQSVPVEILGYARRRRRGANCRRPADQFTAARVICVRQSYQLSAELVSVADITIPASIPAAVRGRLCARVNYSPTDYRSAFVRAWMSDAGLSLRGEGARPSTCRSLLYGNYAAQTARLLTRREACRRASVSWREWVVSGRRVDLEANKSTIIIGAAMWRLFVLAPIMSSYSYSAGSSRRCWITPLVQIGCGHATSSIGRLRGLAY